MKRVLIITYYWPPSGGAGVQRWLKFAKYLPGTGWNPVIYTPENQEVPAEDPSLMKDIHPDTEVIRKPIWEPYQFYKKFLGMSRGERVNAGFLAESSRQGRKEKISVWIRGNLFIPDARKYWVKPSCRFITQYLVNNPVDAIISTGPPHSMHLIALKIKEKTGIPWLADFRDPWTGIDFYDQLQLTRRADKKHHRLEKRVLEKADRVVVVGNNMKQQFSQLADTSPIVIPNGYDHEDFVLKEAQPAQTFSIVHAGAMNRDRNHEIFWKTVRSVISEQQLSQQQIKIKLIGKLDHTVTSSIKKNNLEEFTEVISYLPHEDLISELQAAALLYLPINNTPNAKGIQTGKIFEYIASGQPILGIGPPDGDAAAILAECRAGTMAGFDDGQAVRRALSESINDFFSGKRQRSKPCEHFTRQNLTRQLAEILDNI
jgi:glycosyltransferase involved in cell wall biosynthesis